MVAGTDLLWVASTATGVGEATSRLDIETI